MTASRQDPRIGTNLGPYHIDGVLGRGGMGVVYLAEQPSLGRKVALKVLAPDLVDEEAFRQRFVRESQMAAAIDHPNILPIYEAGEVEGVYFLAMRYVEGTDLESRLRGEPLEPREVVQLLAQVASALDAASEAGLVHRDVKPANVLIASGKGVEKADHAYLTDFGLTKHRGSQTGLTQSGAFMGTLDYIAPEQVEGRDVDGRTDQYSLACVAFHCLTGRTPFPRDTDIAIAMAHLHESPPSATALVPELPIEVDAVLARGMAKKPDDRYPTSEAFVGALRQALGVRPTEPHPLPPGALASRRPLIAGVVAVAGLVAIVGIALLMTRAGGPGAGASPNDGAGAAYPNAAEAALIARLPEELKADCVRGSYAAQPSFEQPNSSGVGIPDAEASVVCTLAGDQAAQQLYLQTYPSTEAGTAFLRDRINVIAQQVGTALPGDCATRDQARGRWANGDLICYQLPGFGRSWIYWTDLPSDLLGAASREDLDAPALYAWWAASATTIHDRIEDSPGPDGSPGTSAPTVDSSPFPTLTESSLILSLPQDTPPACERGDGALLPTRQGPSVKPRAHIVCRLLGGQGPDVVEVILLPPTEFFSGSEVIGAIATSAGIIEGDCATDAQGLGEWSNALGDEGGSYLCRPTVDGGTELVWSLDNARAFYHATALDGDHAALYDWWVASRESIEP